jgi:hypothetical protein
VVLVCLLRYGLGVLWRPAGAVRDRQRRGRSHGLCQDPLPAGCNDTIWTVHPTQPDIITVYPRFGRSATHLFGSISFDDLRVEIDGNPGRPVEVCYAWTGGDSHVALVCGYSVDQAGAQFVKVNDPADNIGLISFASLQSAYGLGTWVETFIKIQ